MSNTPDLAEFEQLSAPKKRPCPVPGAVATLAPPDQASVTAALTQPSTVITNTAISTWFARRDITIGHAHIRSHRHSTCSCG